MDAARYRLGLRIPEELGVIGFDDIALADADAYALTTIRQPFEQMVNLSVEMLVARIDDPGLKSELKILPGELIERGSVRKPSRDP